MEATLIELTGTGHGQFPVGMHLGHRIKSVKVRRAHLKIRA